MLWSIEMQWRLEQAETAEQGLRMVFEESAAQIARARFLMPEIVVHQLRGNAEGLPTCAPPTLGDKLLRLDDMPGASAFEALPIQTLIGRSVRNAIADNELSSDTDDELFTWVLCSLFFGSTAASPDPEVVARVLVRGFDRLWMAHSSSTGLNR